jgi:hypothetical protein
MFIVYCLRWWVEVLGEGFRGGGVLLLIFSWCVLVDVCLRFWC